MKKLLPLILILFAAPCFGDSHSYKSKTVYLVCNIEQSVNLSKMESTVLNLEENIMITYTSPKKVKAESSISGTLAGEVNDERYLLKGYREGYREKDFTDNYWINRFTGKIQHYIKKKDGDDMTYIGECVAHTKQKF